jgi:hypothetical protein
MEHVPPSPPFIQDYQLCHELDLSVSASANHLNPTQLGELPGQPWISLTNTGALTHFLVREYWARSLEEVASYLWILSTQSSANVKSLHKQKVQGREILVTEDPRLHLVWVNDRIFIKPLPRYLLSYQFWNTYLLSSSSPLGESRHDIRKAALGYLRTYHHLIQHESDLKIAQHDSLRLVSPDINWTDYCRFASQLGRIRDADVSSRYHYGELRLSRLNLYAPLLFHRFYYEQVHGQYGQYFARFYGPILFVFAVMSTLLNAMQVAMAADGGTRVQVYLWQVFYWFSIVGLVVTVLITCLFSLLWLWMVADEWIYAVGDRRRKGGDLCREAQK